MGMATTSFLTVLEVSWLLRSSGPGTLHRRFQASMKNNLHPTSEPMSGLRAQVEPAAAGFQAEKRKSFRTGQVGSGGYSE